RRALPRSWLRMWRTATGQCEDARAVARKGIAATSSGRAELGRSVMDRGTNPVVRGAATDVAAHGHIDVAVGRCLEGAEQRNGTHDLPGLAESALRDIARDPCTPDRLRLDS